MTILPMPRFNLLPSDLERYRLFGVTPDLLEQFRVQRVTDQEAREFLGPVRAGDMSGIAYHYWSVYTGNRVTTRVRRDHADIGSNGKPDCKYIQGYGDASHLYWPPGSKEMLFNPETFVVLVEAECSVLALTAYLRRRGDTKLLAVAMGGAYGFKGKDKALGADGKLHDVSGFAHGLELLDNGRRVIVMLDTNIHHNSAVQAAERGLCQRLLLQGAKPEIARLPLNVDGSPLMTINGPDDYLAVEGDDAMAKVLAAVVPFSSLDLRKLPVIELPRLDNEREHLVYPLAALEGDYVSELAQELSVGTAVPPQFVRENLKVVLGAVHDARVGFPRHTNLSTRQYSFLVSELPQGCKGESWRRTGAPLSNENPLGGALNRLLVTHDVSVVDGTKIGSGEFFAMLMHQWEKEDRRPWLVLYYDEGRHIFEKNSAQGSTLESARLSLYDSGSHWTGSKKDKGTFGSDKIHLSLVANFTRAGFEDAFTGQGAGSSGFLSRVTLSYSGALTVVPEWRERDPGVEEALSAKLSSLVPPPNGRTVPDWEPRAHDLWLDFIRHLKDPRNPKATLCVRLDILTKQDLLTRTLYSRNSSVITRDAVDRSILWAGYQLELRQALWPIDRGDAVERMALKIKAALTKYGGQLSVRQLLDRCHVERPGSGGPEAFNRAVTALQRSGEIEAIGRTQRNSTVYALVKDDSDAADAERSQ